MNPLRRLPRGITAFLAYVIPSFAIAVLWHLVLFAGIYDDLAIYRADKNIPLGLATMCLQGAVFAMAYPQLGLRGTVVSRGLKFGLFAGLLAWSYMVLAVAAKHPMASVPDYLLIESAFTALQWVVAGPLIALAYGSFPGSVDAPAPVGESRLVALVPIGLRGLISRGPLARAGPGRGA